jgi:uncharacterized protein YdeI (YjbR/CyaY-like superfamily)
VKPRFFKTPRELREWMNANHATARELLIGFYKKASGKPSVVYQEALDEALAVGWIDGLRKNLTADSYTIRFTPRSATSFWSQVNIARVKELIAQDRMRKPGLAAFEQRDESRARQYSYERDASAFERAQLDQFKADKKAWAFFEVQPPGYRKLAAFYVTSAKKEETRARRLATVIELSHNGRRLDLMTRAKKRP